MEKKGGRMLKNESLLKLVIIFLLCLGWCFVLFQQIRADENVVVGEQTNTQVSEEKQSYSLQESNDFQQGEQGVNQEVISNEEKTALESNQVEKTPAPSEEKDKSVVPPASQEGAKTISLDFKEADIKSILRIISLKSGVNIVSSPDVTGLVTIRLDNVDWEKALAVLLDTYGYGYVKKGNIISVSPLDKLTEQKKKEQELAQVQATASEVFHLKFIDAADAKKALEPLISPRGKITILEMTGKSGWAFAGETFAKVERKEKERKSRASLLVVTDIPPKLEEIREVLKVIDKQPEQILIESTIVEVSRDYLRDIGFDYATGTVSDNSYIKGSDNGKFMVGGYSYGGKDIDGSGVSPAIFNPSKTGLTPLNSGLELALKKISGSQWEMIFHALEEDVHANILSAPKILTLNNQEATILVGKKYPILKTTQSEATTNVQLSLDYYQDIGIQLNVVPQISGENQISMIIHPAVSTFTQTVGQSPTLYPIIETREAETQVLINDGETIVIGGLIKEIDNKEKLGIPFLSKIPFIGALFRRDTRDLEKIELLIFIKATIVKPEKNLSLTQEDMKFLEGKAISK